MRYEIHLTSLGLIPGFSSTLFSTTSLIPLQAIANLGLIFYLFLVGLELDLALIRTKAREAVFVSLAGIIFPFALGAGVSYYVYISFMADSDVSFGSFLLFMGVAMSITAFPVLARILSEFKLFTTPVGECFLLVIFWGVAE